MSYYDDSDFAAEYRRRDEDAIDAEIREREIPVRRIFRQCSCGLPILGSEPCAHGRKS